jgi:putative acetyltransferase
MPVTIMAERPDTADAIMLITELEGILQPLYPPASRHGLSVEQLIAEEVAFFLLRSDGTPAGCGGVKLCGLTYAEIKRMYVRPPFRGRGFARAMLTHLEDHARAHGVGLLRLETGILQRDAIALYERTGFYRRPPFGSYHENPLSLFYEKPVV